jgi:hypothetical protein
VIWVIAVIWVILGVNVRIRMCKIHGFARFIEGLGFLFVSVGAEDVLTPTGVWCFFECNMHLFPSHRRTSQPMVLCFSKGISSLLQYTISLPYFFQQTFITIT